jgi:hypothetical protein
MVVSIIIVAGCASMPAPKVDNRLQQWRGVSIDDLVTFWGLPIRQVQLAENHIAEWINQLDKDGNVAVSVGGGNWGRHSSIGIGLTLFNLGGGHEVCQRQVTYTPEGVILKIIWSGDNDYCYELTPDREEILQKQQQVQKLEQEQAVTFFHVIVNCIKKTNLFDK